MIDRLEIRNFKSIAGAELAFGRVNLFIGANGSGKSNLLEAIGLYSACLGRGIDASILSSKGVRLSAPHILKSSFKNRRIPDAIHLSGFVAGIKYSASLRPKPSSSQLAFASESLVENGNRIFFRSPRGAGIERVRNEGDSRKPPAISVETDAHRSLWDTHGSLVEIGACSREALRAVAKYVIYAPQTAVMRGISTDNRGVEPLGLTGGRLPQAFREVLKQRYNSDSSEIDEIFKIIWSPGWAKEVRTEPDLDAIPDVLSASKEDVYILDRYMTNRRNWLSANDASEGTLYLLFVATILAHAESPPIFALDNVDGTLNPAMVRQLVEHIVAVMRGELTDEEETSIRPRQVFLTSHNPTALDAIDLFESDHRLFVVSRNERGHTVFERIQPSSKMTKEEWVKAQRGRNLSQLWLDGRIRKALG
jgi:predicted ATPase